MRVGVVADLPEEGWPSMDLVATMLHAALRADGVAATLIRPAMARRFSRPATMRGRGYTADRLVNRWWDYPRVLRRARRDADVFHVTDHSYAHLLRVLPPRRTVVTCHDLDTFRSVLEPAAEPRGWPFRAMTRRILAGFRAAARVVCDSEATAAAVVRHGLVPAARLRVVPLGVHPAFARRDPAAERALERRLGERGGRVEILHVGSTIARKRIDVLLDVFAGIRRRVPGARLLRVGGAFTEAQQAQVARLGLAGEIVVLPWLDWDELAALYGRAALVLVPSEREGFGLPVLEGLARGTPVVASDIPALRETGGALATYRPVGDVEAWVSAALAHLGETEDAARPIEGEARIAHASKFTWSDCARRMAEVYREVLAESGG
jgi:glycosyltransferase involved in cell wall biosynthesis